MSKVLGRRLSKRIVVSLAVIGVAMLMFGCGKKPSVNLLGDNLTWTYSKMSKTLTISGRGNMPDTTWEEFKDLSIKTLVIEEGVTSIAKSAFYNHNEMTGKLTLPKTISKIEDFAFYGCSGLTGGLVIPEGVTRIGDYAFRGCESFNGELILPSTVTSIGEEAFYKTAFTGKLVFPEKLEHIGRAVFYECTGFTGDLLIPDSVTEIGAYAFAYTKGFDGILKLPEGIEEIEDSAFSGCGNFKSDLVIPDSVRVIGENAFGYNGFEGRIRLSSGLTDIGDYAFSGCSFSGRVEIPEGISSIGNATFKDCINIEEVVVSDGLGIISAEAFYGCKSLKKIEFPIGLKIIGDSAFSRCGLTGHIVFPEGLCSIGESSFRSCGKITGITLPDTLLNIKDNAFADCEELAGDLAISDCVAYVGEKAFRNCAKLSSVVFGDGIASIGPGAFEGCSGLKSAAIGDYMPDYYSKDEENPSFEETTELIGFDDSKKGSTLWNNYKESKLSEISSKTEDVAGDADAKSEPYYWTDRLAGETYKGTGSYADTALYFMDGTITASINGREYIKVPYEADPDEDERRIKVDNFVYLYGLLSDLEFYDNGYMKSVIKATLSLDDGSETKVFFAVGSEETVLPVGYEDTGAEYFEDDLYEEADDEFEEEEETEFLGKIDIDDDFEYHSWGEPYLEFEYMKHLDERHEDSDGNPIVWFGDLDKLMEGCSVYCAVEKEEISAAASSTLKAKGSINYDADNVCVQNNFGAWVEGSDGSGIGESIEIKRRLDVSDKAYGIDYKEICIVNGYFKNEQVWKNNNRVKTLAFYYNDEYICDLDLKDIYSPQYISLEEYGIHAGSGEEVVFKFVIKDVYKGDKYDDTAITGIIVDFYTPNH